MTRERLHDQPRECIPQTVTLADEQDYFPIHKESRNLPRDIVIHSRG